MLDFLLDNIVVGRPYTKLYYKRDDFNFSIIRLLAVTFQLRRRMAYTFPSSYVFKSLCPLQRFSRQNWVVDTETAQTGIC